MVPRETEDNAMLMQNFEGRTRGIMMYQYHCALSCLMRNSKSLKLKICKIFDLMVMV